jgi:hypothetical protein|tara:strand:+ start:2137 stop:2811 length:675 start_codon:yes stop_codon:yes gene_type:complete
MAEVEFAGVKFTGGKMVALIVSLSTLGGGAYGVFEAYKQFTDMQSAISEYVSPDLSHIDNHMTMVSGELGIVEAEFVALKEADSLMNELVREQVNSIKSTVAELQTQIHDLKIEQKVDLSDMSARLDKDIEKQSSKLITSVEQITKDLNKVIKSTDDQEIRNRSSIRDTDLLLRGNVKTIRDIISSFEIRMDAKLTKLDEKIDSLEENLDKKIQRALINPLLGG